MQLSICHIVNGTKLNIVLYRIRSVNLQILGLISLFDQLDIKRQNSNRIKN